MADEKRRKEIERTIDELGAMSRKDLDTTARKYGLRIGMFTRKFDAVRYLREELGKLVTGGSADHG